MPGSKFTIKDPFTYHTGLNSYHESAAIEDALPRPQSLPQRHSLGLYPERISGTSFTAKRAVNKQTFLYRILPSTAQSSGTKLSDHPLNHRSHSAELNFVPDQLIWPPAQVQEDKTFLDGLQMIGGAGDPTVKNGVAYYVYTCGLSMDEKQAFYSADGDMLVVPQMGVLDTQTEKGDIRVCPREICVVPRGIRFRLSLPEGPSRGHAIEAYSGHFDLPELGPIGSLGLANVRDFEIPRARYVDTEEITEVIAKFGGGIYSAEMKGSAFNAVAWHGTYYPFKYDLEPQKALTDPALIADAFLIKSLAVMSQAATILGPIRFWGEYVTPSGRLASDSQTAYALAICFDLVSPQQATVAGNRLAKIVQANRFRIETGLAGIPFICEALARTGHVDMAYQMLLNDPCPSWLYPITLGATNIWGDDLVQPLCAGGVCKFLVERLAGLQRVSAGWRRSRVRPLLGGGFKSASASHITAYGIVSCRWSLFEEEGDPKHMAFKFDVVVPPTTTMEVVIPIVEGNIVRVVGSGHWSFSSVVRKGPVV